MPTAPPPTPVHRTVFSADESEVTGFIRQTYAENSSRFAPIREGARFSALTHDVPGLGADRVRTSIDYSGTSAEGFSDFTFFLVHAGSVHVDSPVGSVTATAGDVAFYPLGTPVEFAMDGFDVTTLRLPSHHVDDAARLLADGPVTFGALTPVSPAAHRYWRSLLKLVAGALADPDSPLGSPLLAAEMARTAAVACLHVFPHSATSQHHLREPAGPMPATVRRAVAHIEARAHEPVQLHEIAAAAGATPRALQHGFRRHLGTSPLGHLRRVRLELAHRELRSADPAHETVAAVAARWGFANAGRFAAAHLEAFGELPSQTLRM
ncbi:helix-turn-helix domain-containing protein [Streptomyces sp. NP160]|uniref:AraC family transcriptional regulator n=1 Tax=Streptomyces sp. NP160 TaxID=2586637 RepID=UPI00111A2EDB|nr:AraC family transcriptional regulator [Streptomyces sp. NP160]TNM69190.1 helix-turn-helix domain-containing protein [Streptomyces sp. NP160]